MKSEEEIKMLAKEEYPSIIGTTQTGIGYDMNSREKEAFFKGYKQCQEEMKKQLYEFGKLVLDTFHSEGKTNSGEARIARIKYHEWFNRLNKQDND